MTWLGTCLYIKVPSNIVEDCAKNVPCIRLAENSVITKSKNSRGLISDPVVAMKVIFQPREVFAFSYFPAMSELLRASIRNRDRRAVWRAAAATVRATNIHMLQQGGREAGG